MECAPDAANAVVPALDARALQARRDLVAGRVEEELRLGEDRGGGQVPDADLFRAAVGCRGHGTGGRQFPARTLSAAFED